MNEREQIPIVVKKLNRTLNDLLLVSLHPMSTFFSVLVLLDIYSKLLDARQEPSYLGLSSIMLDSWQLCEREKF